MMLLLLGVDHICVAAGYAAPVLPDPLLHQDGMHHFPGAGHPMQQQAFAGGPAHSDMAPREDAQAAAPEQTSVHSDSSEWGHGALPDGASYMEVPGEGACASSRSILHMHLSLWRLTSCNPCVAVSSTLHLNRWHSRTASS